MKKTKVLTNKAITHQLKNHNMLHQIKTLYGNMNLQTAPDECPYCHNKITPVNIYGFRNSVTSKLDTVQLCPNLECHNTFISYYNEAPNGLWYYNGTTTQGILIGRDFSKTIEEISKDFVLIYNQSFVAEQQNLNEICGVGYRKSLEFLIKDYLIKKTPADNEKIEKKLLGPCISDLVDDSRIKSVAKRAVWLGNDETHYIKKWEGKNLNDLKKLIDLTVHWIEMEALTISFETEMPE